MVYILERFRIPDTGCRIIKILNALGDINNKRWIKIPSNCPPLLFPKTGSAKLEGEGKKY
jgi:hypothetical protein